MPPELTETVIFELAPGIHNAALSDSMKLFFC